MSNMIRLAALLAFVTAGCVSSNEVAQAPVAPTTDPVSLFSEMHAAIPADKGNGKFFEYN